MARFKVTIETGFAGGIHEDEFEIPDEELEQMTAQEREKAIDEAGRDIVANYISFSVRQID